VSALDVSTILLATTALALLLFAVRLVRLPRALAIDWWLTTLGVAALGGGAWFVARELAGAFALGVFVLAIVAPMRLDALALRAGRRGDLPRAEQLARLAAVLHPFGLVRRRRRAILALARLRDGVPLDDDALHAVGAKDDPLLGELYRLVGFDALGESAALLEALAIPSRRTRMLRLGLGAAWVRAVGERLDRTAIVDAIRTAESEDTTLLDPDRLLLFLLEAQAAIGDVSGVDALATSLATRAQASELSRARIFARLQTGDRAGARALLDEALASAWGARPPIARLSTLLLRERAPVGTSSELEALREHLREEAVAVHALSPIGGGSAMRARTPLTTATAAVLVAVFVLEAATGDATATAHLAHLGALVLPMRGAGDLSRIVTSAFLHAGVAHLVFNLASLVAFGRFVEHFFGRLGYLAIYLAAIVGSAGLVIAVTSGAGGASAAEPKVLVGASGAIFGLFGAYLGAVITRRELRQSRRGREQLRLFVLLVGAQLALEQLVPQIATSAHVGGLLAGGLVGAVLARSRRLAAPAT
jgi:membrane associated rhomboid family serine protease